MRIDHDPLSASVIGAGIEVHRHLGPGLFESAYEECLAWELEARRVQFRRQLVVPVVYKGVPLDASYRVDLLVSDTLVVEVKAVEHLTSVHDAQVLTYMKISGAAVGLLLNFNTPVLRDGIRRFSAPTEGAGRRERDSGQERNGATEAPRHRGQRVRAESFAQGRTSGGKRGEMISPRLPK